MEENAAKADETAEDRRLLHLSALWTMTASSSHKCRSSVFQNIKESQRDNRTRKVMEEIESYLNKLTLDVKEYKFTEKDNLKVGKRCFEHGQLLVNIGKQKESLEFLEVAWKFLRQASNEDLYKNIYEIAGLLYASTLDYLNEIPASERIFQELNEKNPNGFHLGDYAYFLHRRKRDFDNAERFPRLLYP
jgi:tetratricopeptide (TPR) repeat protein